MIIFCRRDGHVLIIQATLYSYWKVEHCHQVKSPLPSSSVSKSRQLSQITSNFRDKQDMIQDLGRPLVIQDCPRCFCLLTLVNLLPSATPVVSPAARSNQNCISSWGPCGAFGGPKVTTLSDIYCNDLCVVKVLEKSLNFIPEKPKTLWKVQSGSKDRCSMTSVHQGETCRCSIKPCDRCSSFLHQSLCEKPLTFDLFSFPLLRALIIFLNMFFCVINNKLYLSIFPSTGFL